MQITANKIMEKDAYLQDRVTENEETLHLQY